MLQLKGLQGSGTFQKFRQYHLAPAKFMLCVESEMEERQAEETEPARVRRASWGAELGLDGLWARQSYHETTRSASEDLLSG